MQSDRQFHRGLFPDVAAECREELLLPAFYAVGAGPVLPHPDRNVVADDLDHVDHDNVSAARTCPERGDDAHLSLPVHRQHRRLWWLTETGRTASRARSSTSRAM